MSRGARRRTRLVAPAVPMALLVVLLGVPVWAAEPSHVLREQGRATYTTYCAGCHGEQGDGHGPAAAMLLAKPRDFTKGIYKFRSTPSGTLPTDEDLYKIITRGVYRTSMPDWGLLTERERLAVVAYIKGFYPDWERRGAGTTIYIPAPPESLGSSESVARGRELYEMLECTACHGSGGRGDGEAAKALDPDVWGNPQKPFDFTKGRLKSGPSVQDIYRTFMTGVGGTAMPSYADIFGEPDGENIFAGDAWHLVSYIVSLRSSAVAGKDPSK